MSKTYLVTGGAGFIGRHLCRELLAHGCEVRVLDSLVEQVHGGAGAQLPDCVEFIKGDVRDSGAVAGAIRNVDGVFHLAAEVGVGQSMYEVSRYVGANDHGTAILLEQLIGNPVERLVVASSMSVYGEGRYRDASGAAFDRVRREGQERAGAWDPCLPGGASLIPVATDETKQVDLASIYALTKYAQERSCLIVGKAYGMSAVALRLFNVFGPGQALSNPYTGVLANFGARLMHGQRPMVFEDGRQQRDFVHVTDVARAFRLAMECPAVSGHVINIGSGHAYTISQVAELLADAMEVSLPPQVLGKARAGDIRHCFADIAKARALLRYAPPLLMEEGVHEIAASVREQDAQDRGEDARQHLETRGLVA